MSDNVQPTQSGPPETAPPSRTTRLLTSWKLWLVALMLAVVGIGASLTIRGYQRHQAFKYLDEHGCTYELTDDSEWITEWFGERAMGLRSVDSVFLAAVTDESFVRISVFPELRNLSTIGQFEAVAIAVGHGASSPIRVDTISDRGIDALLQLSQLESISLNGGRFTDAQLTRLFSADLPLVDVKLNLTNASRVILEALTQIPTLSSLQFGDLGQPRDEDFRGLDSIPTLRSLVIGEVGPEAAQWIPRLSGLQHLDMSFFWYNRDLSHALSGLEELRSLSITFSSPDAGEAALATLSTLPQLEVLEVSSNVITWKSLEHLRKMPSLKRIVVTTGDIADSELRNVVEREWELETLNPIGGGGFGGGGFF